MQAANSIKNNWILFLSIPQLVLIVITSSISAFTIEFYSLESLNWQAQSVGQDYIDLLLISPVLIVSSILAWNGQKTGFVIWAGTNLYLIYTYTIFSFSVHFNQWFLFYCLILGLSFYSFLLFVFRILKQSGFQLQPARWLRNTTGVYFIFICVVFYFLWLAEIIPPLLAGVAPTSLSEVGLFTNPVHVLDLSIILPAIGVVGIGILFKNHTAYLFAAVLLVFFILMNITIAALTGIMYGYGFNVSLAIVYIMVALTLVSKLLFWKITKWNIA